MPETITVAIIDDQPLFASGIGMLVEAEPDMTLLAIGHNGHDALEIARSLSPDVLLMDLRMPELNGLEASRRILATQEPKQPKIVVLTTIERDQVVYDAFRVGVTAFLTKDSEPAVVIDTIRQAADDDVSASTSEPADIIRALTKQPTSKTSATQLAQLSAREREVLQLVSHGRSNAEIAARLWIAEPTVKSHVRAILSKLQLQSRIQLVIFAYENSLIIPADGNGATSNS